MPKDNNKRIMTYAYDKDKNRVSINQVESGLKCNCFCIGCGKPVIAKNNLFEGRKKQIFFSHMSAEDKHNPESYLHQLAKEIIKTEKRLAIPCDQDGKLILHTKPNSLFAKSIPWSLLDVRLEVQLPDLSIVPDAMALLSDGKTCIAIEIVVTHDIDEEKFRKLKNANFGVLRIDLSSLVHEISDEELVDLICNTGNQSEWVFLPTVKEVHQQQSYKIPTAHRYVEREAGLEISRKYFGYKRRKR